MDKPRKRVPKVKKPRRISLSGLKAKMWDKFRAYIRERDGNVCFTCDKGGLEGVDWHAGHFITRRKGSVLYDPANVHSQCSYCNRHLKGNAAEYAYRFIQKYGQAKFDALLLKSRVVKPWKPNELRDLMAALDKGGADFELLYETKYGVATDEGASFREESALRGLREKGSSESGQPQGGNAPSARLDGTPALAPAYPVDVPSSVPAGYCDCGSRYGSDGNCLRENG